MKAPILSFDEAFHKIKKHDTFILFPHGGHYIVGHTYPFY